MKGRRSRGANIELGLAVSGALLPPKCTRTQEELAAFAGVTKTYIQEIERRALKKMRIRLEEKGFKGIEVAEALKLFR